MTEEQTEAVGWFADEVLSHPYFQLIKDEFERTVCYEILHSIPPAHAEREETYYLFNGAIRFIEFLKTIKAEKDKIVKQRVIQAQLQEGLDELEADAQLEDEAIFDDGYQL